jgi:hypothetical protein
MPVLRYPSYIGICLGVVGCVLAELPVTRALDIPSITNVTLRSISRKDFADAFVSFAPFRPKNALLTIYVESGWMYSHAIFICKNDDKPDEIITVTEPTIDEAKTTAMIVRQVHCEPELAGRIISLLSFELRRAKQGPKAFKLDGTSYHFHCVPEPGSELWGQTDVTGEPSTINRLTKLGWLLGSLANVKEYDRTSLLGEIVREVTAIEVAYKQARLLPP